LLINRKVSGKLVEWLVRVHRINMLLIMHHIALCTPCIALFNYSDGNVLMDNPRPGGALRWKVETAGWEGQGVVRGKMAPPRL
jgi:hypothetical protein